MSDELKRCPFCGGEPKVFYHNNKFFGETVHIECLDDNCGCGTCHHDSKAIAVTVWNRRLPLGLQTEIDYLESEIGERDDKIDLLNHANQELQSDNARLREALKPFAELGFPYAVEAMGETNDR